jgi:SAM-dependent methyltransferase
MTRTVSTEARTSRAPSPTGVLGPGDGLAVSPPDRRCRPWSLDNGVRRAIFPPDRTLRALELAPGQTVVDLGAGVGYFAQAILERIGPEGRLILVDPDERNLRRARERLTGDSRVEFRVGEAGTALDLPEVSADRLLLYLVLCCLHDKEGALAKAWSLLRPGGLALVSYPVRRRSSRRTLRMTDERWASLVLERPWRVERSWGRFLRHHLLRKPAPPEPQAAGGGASSIRREIQDSLPART